MFKIMKGKSKKVITSSSHLFTANRTNNFLKPNIVSIPTQPLPTSYRDNNLYQNSSTLELDKQYYLSFKLNITSSKLTKTTHYNSYQQKLYRLIKFLKEKRGIGYRRISHILTEKGYRSVRTKSVLKNNYIYSIYKKGKVREERIERSFDSKIDNLNYTFRYSN